MCLGQDHYLGASQPEPCGSPGAFEEEMCGSLLQGDMSDCIVGLSLPLCLPGPSNIAGEGSEALCLRIRQKNGL